MGYPGDDLNMVAMGHPNVYVCLSLLVPWALSSPYKFAHLLGEALRWVGSERIIWGTDYAGYGAQVAATAIGLQEFQMPEELQEKYGYPALTQSDKANIFRLNLRAYWESILLAAVSTWLNCRRSRLRHPRLSFDTPIVSGQHTGWRSQSVGQQMVNPSF
ncbi:MAG: amidohydrolase family protein [Anaerolineae bacterium]